MPISFLNLSPVYTIGQAVLGGIIFYILQPNDIGYSMYKQSGLIAATSDQSTSVIWGCQGTNISGANGTAIGTGAANTAAILAGCATRPIGASVAAAHNGGGYSDWYLPSKDELDKLYQNRVVAGISGFASYGYLTSSNYNLNPTDVCWLVDMGSGNVTAYFKSITYYVRAIRSY